MILFDLRCAQDHLFEGWFSDSEGFEAQVASGDVLCPVCGDAQIEKALMAPNLTDGKKVDASQNEHAANAVQMLYQMKKEVEDNCDNVGGDFAEEARKIHYGETERRNIYGNATIEEAAELEDEDIEFGALPWPDEPKDA